MKKGCWACSKHAMVGSSISSINIRLCEGFQGILCMMHGDGLEGKVLDLHV